MVTGCFATHPWYTPGVRWPAVIGSRRWIATLSAMTAVTALSIEMSLPAQPAFARAFGVSRSTAQLTLSLFLVGFAPAQIITGWLSDRIGRRRVMLGGLALFTVSGVACALSPTIELLLASRVIQGVGAAAAPVVARAMVRDTQPGAQSARLLSTMLAALAVAPMIAPVLGGVLVVFTHHFGLAGFHAPMLVYFFGIGLTSPSATALAMEPVPQLAGTASATIGALQMLAGAISGYQTTRIGGSSPSTFALVLLAMGSLAFVLALAATVNRRHTGRERARSGVTSPE